MIDIGQFGDPTTKFTQKTYLPEQFNLTIGQTKMTKFNSNFVELGK